MTRKIISILLVASMLLTMTFGSFISKAADVIPEGYKSFDVSVNFDVYPTDTQHDPSNYKVYIFPDYFEAAESTDEVAFFISENYTFFFDMFNFEPFEVPELTYQSNASNGVMLADTSVVRPETENPAGKFMVVFYNDNGVLRLAVKQNGTLETDYNYEEGSFAWYSLSETSIKLKKYVDDNTYSHYVQDNKSSQSRTYFIKYSCDKDGNVIKENQFHESGEVLYKQVINVYEDGSLVESYSLSCNGYKYLNNLDKQHTEYSYNNGATKSTTYNFDFATKKYVFGNCVETNTITEGNITEESTVYYVDDIIQNSSYKKVTTYGDFGILKEVNYTYDNEWVATYQKAYTYDERGWKTSIIYSEILDMSFTDFDEYVDCLEREFKIDDQEYIEREKREIIDEWSDEE